MAASQSMGFPGPWPVSENECTSALDCQWYEGRRFVRGICSEITSASLMALTGEEKNTLEASTFKMCTCDPRLVLSGVMCNVESRATIIFRYTRVFIVCIQVLILLAGIGAVCRTSRPKVLASNTMWMTLVMSLAASFAAMIWNLSFAVISVGDLDETMQLIFGILMRLSFAVCAALTINAVMLLSIVWIAILEVRKSGLVMHHGKLSFTTYVTTFVVSFLLVLAIAMVNLLKNFRVSGLALVPVVFLMSLLYIYVFYKIFMVKRKLAALDKKMVFARSPDDQNSINNAQVVPRTDQGNISRICRENANPDITRRDDMLDSDETRHACDADLSPLSSSPKTKPRQTLGGFMSMLTDTFAPSFLRPHSNSINDRSSSVTSRSSGNVTTYTGPHRDYSQSLSAIELGNFEARTNAGRFRSKSLLSNLASSRLKRASILIQSLDHMAFSSASMVISLLLIGAGILGVSLTVETFEKGPSAPIFSLIFSFGVAMVHATIIFFVRSAHFSAVQYRRWRVWQQAHPAPLTEETEPSCNSPTPSLSERKSHIDGERYRQHAVNTKVSLAKVVFSDKQTIAKTKDEDIGGIDADTLHSLEEGTLGKPNHHG